jgi:hypothetical protein
VKHRIWLYASESVELKSISDVAHDLGREALFRAVNDKAEIVGTMSRPCSERADECH